MTSSPRSDDKTFFGLHLHLAGRCCKIRQVPGAPRNVNPTQVSRLVGVTNIRLEDATIYCTIFQQQFTSTSPVLKRKNTFEKKISEGKCSLIKLLNLNRGSLGPLVVLVLLNWLFV